MIDNDCEALFLAHESCLSRELYLLLLTHTHTHTVCGEREREKLGAGGQRVLVSRHHRESKDPERNSITLYNFTRHQHPPSYLPGSHDWSPLAPSSPIPDICCSIFPCGLSVTLFRVQEAEVRKIL